MRFHSRYQNLLLLLEPISGSFLAKCIKDQLDVISLGHVQQRTAFLSEFSML